MATGKPVWIVYGDGSLGYSLAEFDTYSRHKLPVTALVGNDACWSQIVREQVPQVASSDVEGRCSGWTRGRSGRWGRMRSDSLPTPKA